MTLLGPNTSTQDKTYSYADCAIVIHPSCILYKLAKDLYTLADRLEDSPPTRANIFQLREIADDVTRYADNHPEDILFRKQLEDKIAEQQDWHEQHYDERP